MNKSLHMFPFSPLTQSELRAVLRSIDRIHRLLEVNIKDNQTMYKTKELKEDLEIIEILQAISRDRNQAILHIRSENEFIKLHSQNILKTGDPVD